MYVCMYVCVCNMFVCVCMYVCVCMRVCVCTYACVCMCMYVCILFIYLLSMLHYFVVILHAINLHVSFTCRGRTDQHHGVSHCVPFTVLNNTSI